MRNQYVTHMNKLEDYANGKFGDDTCYMCEAGRKHPKYDPYAGGACEHCPIDSKLMCNSNMRRLNLRTKEGSGTSDYKVATPKSIRKHIRYIENEIKENTDCELYWK